MENKKYNKPIIFLIMASNKDSFRIADLFLRGLCLYICFLTSETFFQVHVFVSFKRLLILKSDILSTEHLLS